MIAEHMQPAPQRMPMTASNSDLPGFDNFVSHFFAGAVPEDVASLSPAARQSLARLFFDAAANRKAGQGFVTVYTPDFEADGFAFPVTILATINDDKPFLVDSILSELNESGAKIRAVFHPIFKVSSSGKGGRDYVYGDSAKSSDTHAESMICVVFGRVASPDQLRSLETSVSKVLVDVSSVVADWRPMLERLDESIAELWQFPPQIAKEDVEETLAFLQWLKSNHFTFLGARDYVFDGRGDGALTPVADSGLGLLRDTERRIVRRGGDRVKLTPEVRSFLMQPSPLIVTKSVERSPVHRRVPEDYIGIKRYSPDGKLTGERRFVGLFTSSAYNDSPRDIPFLRRKVANVTTRSGFPKSSHNAKSLAVVLETFPRDELFQISEDDLLRIGPALAYLGDRPDTKAFIRFDQFSRFASALVYFPADKFRGGLIRSIGGVLTDMLGGQVASAFPHTEEGHMTRVHYTITLPDGGVHGYDDAKLQARIAAVVRLWTDNFAEELQQKLPAGQAEAYYLQYAGAFNEAYRVAFRPAEAIEDFAKLESVSQAGAGALALRTRSGDSTTDGTIWL
jgi:glutamate dehydrogenase